MPLVRQPADEAAVAAAGVDVRFSCGTKSLPVFQEIAARLAGIRGDFPDAIADVGHGVYFHPGRIAAYIREQAAP